MSDARSQNLAQDMPSPAQAIRVRRKSEAQARMPSTRPSPYSPKVQPALNGRSFPENGAGIGGPAKRRESMSGIGNNLRSHPHAGLGRSVGKQKDASSPEGEQPSGISNILLRRRSTDPAHRASSVNSISLPTHNRRRRGSTSTAAPMTADTSTHYSRSTVFPMNYYATSTDKNSSPQNPIRRRTTLAIRRNADSTQLPLDRVLSLQDESQGPAYLYPVSPLSLPPTSPGIPISVANSQSAGLRAIWESSSQNENDSDGNTISQDGSSSPRSSVDTVTAIGLPHPQKVVDVVGSPSNPAIVYAPIQTSSQIGGAEKSKTTMKQSHGIGGSFGKNWMADRPSGIGAAVSQDTHPESGISKVLKALGIKKNKKK
ncbi:hypothetical protein H4217_008644 [Coemansia sp. RSA 1939]|nr:hypothetical protein H4217_008644 [Coemansia sp. RSA 1939]KAJ2608760.1 hypothetical protein EV177_004806 [Coemansia sp. RSA 1804]